MKPDSSEGGSPSNAQSGRPPPAIPNYQPLRPIGGGSYGEVWLARDVMGNYCAIKLVYRRNFSDTRPYEREFEGIKRFVPVSRAQPGQVNILHVGLNEEQGFFYYAMELADDANTNAAFEPVSGQAPSSTSAREYVPKTLKWLLGRGQALPPEDCLQIALTLTSALEYLHRHGLVHRDIKPSNIIFVNGLPKLADIGLVAEASETCTFVGTEDYVPREGPGRPPADIFGLGKVLYEMVTGRSVKDFPALPDWADWPDVEQRKELNQVIMRACEPNVSWRYSSTQEIQEDLRLLIDKKSLARFRALQHTVRRLKTVAAVLTLLLTLGVLVTGFWQAKEHEKKALLLSELNKTRLSRSGTRQAGWFDLNWSSLSNAATNDPGPEWQAQVLAVLAGLDARKVWLKPQTKAGSICFAADDRVLVGGVQGTSGVILDSDGNQTSLQSSAVGPVWWAVDGSPMQLAELSDGFAVLEMHTGKIRRRLPFPPGAALREKSDNPLTAPFPVLAATPDGSRVAAAVTGTPHRIMVWDAVTGEILGAMPVPATALTFSPDGTLLAAGSGDGEIQILSVPGLARVTQLPSPGRSIPTTCLAMALDPLVHSGDEGHTNRWLLAGGYQGGEVIVWDLTTRAPRSYCRGAHWNVLSVAFSPDRLTLATVGRMGAFLWDCMSGQLLLRISEGTCGDEAHAVAFNSTGTRLAWGTEQHGPTIPTVGTWELTRHRGIHSLHGLPAICRRVWYSADSRFIAALSDDWHLAVWETFNDRLLWIFQVPVGDYADNAGVCFNRAGTHLAFSAGTEARLYDLATARTLSKWRLRPGLSDCLVEDSQQRLLLARRERQPGQDRFNWWSVYELGDSGSAQLLLQQTETNWATERVLLPVGTNCFAVWQHAPAEPRHALRIYDLTSGRLMWIKTGNRAQPDVIWEQTGNWIAYQLDDSDKYRLMSLSDFHEDRDVPVELRSLSSTGRQLGFSLKTQSGWLVRDPSSGEQSLPFGLDWAPGCDPVFSPNDRLLAWGTLDSQVIVADLNMVARKLNALRK